MTCALPGTDLLLVSRYSSPEKLIAGIGQFLVGDLTARRGIEGPQIILTWTAPTDPEGLVDRIRIVRKLYSFPTSISDGTILFEGDPGSEVFADCIDVPEKKCIYYRVFSHRSDTDEWFSDTSTSINIVAFNTGDFHWRLLFSCFGEASIVFDKLLETNQDGRLELKADFADDGECFNIYETGVLKGPFARFLKSLGFIFDEIEQLICDIPNQRDVNETCSQNLSSLAALLGFEVNNEIPVARRRIEILNRVEILKIKGTLKSIEAVVQAVTSFNIEVKEWCDNIFLFNQSTFTGTSDDFINSGTANDTNHYFKSFEDGPRSCNTVSVFIDLISSKTCVPPGVISKVNRAVEDTIPACVNADICWLDETYEEEYDFTFMDECESEIEDEHVEEDINKHCWFIFNDLEQGILNGPSVLYYPFGTCGEEYFDIIEEALLTSLYSDGEAATPPP